MLVQVTRPAGPRQGAGASRNQTCNQNDDVVQRLSDIGIPVYASRVESIAEIHVPGSRSYRLATAALHHLRTNFITLAAYTYAAVHYDIGRLTVCG